MSTNKRDDKANDESERHVGNVTPALPEWRSVAIGSASREPQFATYRSAGVIQKPSEAFDSSAVIDKEAYFGKASLKEEEGIGQLKDDNDDDQTSSNWTPSSLRPVPAFYPLEKSSRFVDDDKHTVATRISECLRVLSVHALYDNETACASLFTPENVEMHISLWKTSGGKQPDGIVVELQRRKGCSITFHRYSRHILDAAIGDFDLPEFVRINGVDVNLSSTKKVERLLKTSRDNVDDHENAIIAIEIAHGLLMKDRMDARQLGLESLCLLTDPQKTGSTTALITSRVVLLGTAQETPGSTGEEMVFDEAPFQEIRETILSLIQLRRIGEEGDFEDEDEEDKPPEEKEHIELLNNLALAVLANALSVIENYDSYDTEPEETEKKPAAIRGRCDTADSIAETFMDEAKEYSDRDILSTLIKELGKATNKPHNACLSAKCLSSLCGASDDAKRKAKELGAKNVVNTALEVGVRTHAKLETECKKVVKVLTEFDNNN